MKKIMFDDRFGLTQAVLDGRKTMTRRVIPAKAIEYILGEFKQEYFEGTLDVFDSDKKYIEQYYLVEKCGKCFRPGDVVAVAQSYKDCGYDPGMLQQTYVKKPTLFPELDPYSKLVGWIDLPLKYLKGWINKMFVLAGLMPHQIRITSVRIERIQDISDEDCLREGIVKALGLYGCEGVCERGDQLFFCNPREAFASLITKMAGKKAWDDNPWVFVYEFELIR
jgi:hypothetical protein